MAFGAGTSLEGQVLALHGGVCVDLTQMNHVLRVSADDLDATVQAGVTHRQLNKHLANTGLTFFVDPGADATLGGMTATGASGTTAVRYGTMRENVLGLTVVLADGRVIKTGGRARKSSAGYDLTRLFVGSEGTLGVITEITRAAASAARGRRGRDLQFPSIDSARPDRYRDDPARRACGADRAARRSPDGGDQPLLEARLPGPPDALLRVPRAERTRGERTGRDRCGRSRSKRRIRLRVGDAAGRPVAALAAPATTPTTPRWRCGLARKAWTTDACVPISRLAECIVESKRDLDESPLTGTLVGHVGDGNFHMLYLVDPDCPQEMAEAGRLNERLVDRALDMGGTCTGEHGVGVGKMRYLAREHGEALDAMRAIKQALDPQGADESGEDTAVTRTPTEDLRPESAWASRTEVVMSVRRSIGSARGPSAARSRRARASGGGAPRALIFCGNSVSGR